MRKATAVDEVTRAKLARVIEELLVLAIERRAREGKGSNVIPFNKRGARP